MTRHGEQGVALLTVLMLVAVMSALAVGVLDDIRFGLRRAANAEGVGQAQWYALGAESLARARFARLNQDGTRTSLAGNWNGTDFVFPIDNGAIHARLSDATSCFNLNSVVAGAPEQWSRRDTGIRQFHALLRTIGVPQLEAQALAEALADWIDSDGTRNTLGAEDEAYLNGPRPYRTAGALLSEVSELRAVRGFSGAVYARLRPYVCALPTAELSPININMLNPGLAEILTAITEGALPPEAARRVLASRPAEGWVSAETFWSLPALHDRVPSNDALSQISVRTRFFSLDARVDYAGSEAVLTSLFEQPGLGPARLIARRWTVDE